MGWTPEQEKAIQARGNQILVTAAAGSGKTSVLTERVKNILCDENNKCSVNEVLVVTFTNAAAKEMRTRIGDALKDEIKKTKSGYLKEQLSLLPTADICTIDSFCGRLVKENFNLADISFDYDLLSDGEEKALINETVNEVLSEQYENDADEFEKVNKMFINEKDDATISEIIRSLYDFSRAYPKPLLWLKRVTGYYTADIYDTPWVYEVLTFAKFTFSYCLKNLNKSLEIIRKDERFNNDFLTNCELYIKQTESIIEFCNNNDYDGFAQSVRSFAIFSGRRTCKGANEEEKEFVKKSLDDCKNIIEYFWKSNLPLSSEHREDLTVLLPVIKKLFECTEKLSDKLLVKKKELNKYSFDDILHKCIDILVETDGETFVPTELALSLKEKYKEILIDEYQDTNEAQNIIFETVSRNKTNYYCVGDVKQSIYRFRLASPELFMSLKKNLTDYDGTNKPSRISLNSNFRSRTGVTDAVNFVFSKIMSEEVGEIKYDEKEYLNAKAKYPEKDDVDFEFHYLDAPGMKKQASLEFEAEEIAKYIKAFISQGNMLSDKKQNRERKYTYGDICILLRGVKGRSQVYEEALKKFNIPVYSETDKEAASSKELGWMVSLLKAVSNPLLDVPLASVMMSPIFGFTPDEMSQIRLQDKKADLYSCLLSFSEKSEKAVHFLNKLSLYRSISATYSTEDFTNFLIEDAGINDICLALDNSSERIGVINGIKKAAKDFTESKKTGLSSFVRYIDSLIENDALYNCSSSLNDGNFVKIMSIHKSKGLEFPCVIIANTIKKMNEQELNNPAVVSRKTGMGIKIRDDEKFSQYESLPYSATKISLRRSMVSEEIRILYVAMTRAREKLVIFGTNTQKTLLEKVRFYLNSLSADDLKSGIVPPYLINNAGSYGEWLLYALSLHSDCEKLRNIAGINTLTVPESNFKMNFVYTEKEEFTENDGVFEETPQVNEKLLSIIKEKASYIYPYDSLSAVKAKRTASSAETTSGKEEYFATKRPSFITNNFTGADRGTAVHKFLEKCDFKNAFSSFESEKTALVNNKKLTNEEACILSENDLRYFFNTDVGKRLLKSENIFKEYEFSVLRKASVLYPDLPENTKNEEIVLEGKIDCAFTENGKGIIIDYKTDNTTDETELIKKYTGQLSIYADAFSECEEVPVTEMYIYSFKMKKMISVKKGEFYEQA